MPMITLEELGYMSSIIVPVLAVLCIYQMVRDWRKAGRRR